MKNLLEIVHQDGDKELELAHMQKRLNQWMTTGLLVKYDITPLADGSMLFRIILNKG